MSKERGQTRQQRYEERMRNKGFHSIRLWIPENKKHEYEELAEFDRTKYLSEKATKRRAKG